jgi:hypothetical protein
MPVVINNQTYYRTAGVCRIVGISRNTFFRWLRKGYFPTSNTEAGEIGDYSPQLNWRPLEQRPTTLSRQIGEVRENTANPIRDAEGRVVSCLELARGVTKRKQMEETL